MCNSHLLQTGEKLIVIGHSFGCALALRLVSSHTDITSGLILLGAYTPTGEKPSIFSLAAWLFYLPDWVTFCYMSIPENTRSRTAKTCLLNLVLEICGSFRDMWDRFDKSVLHTKAK